MVEIFEKLIADPNVPVQGTHWAALINAWGCVRKDLNKAVEIFESIRDHPSTRQSRAMFPDAVIFEALINVLVTLRRADLLPIYTAKMSTYGVHMTAYIANLLIKGFAASGDIARAREIFEGLSDPPEGVAAPNNHAPHDSEVVAPNAVPASAPVYREVRSRRMKFYVCLLTLMSQPSTWEAMVRAELGNGNREQAVALLERVQARYVRRTLCQCCDTNTLADASLLLYTTASVASCSTMLFLHGLRLPTRRYRTVFRRERVVLSLSRQYTVVGTLYI